MKELQIEEKLPSPSKPLKVTSPLEELLEKNAFDYSGKTPALFTEAMRYALEYQAKKSSFLKKYYKTLGFSPKSLKKYSELEKAPFVFVNGLKERDLTTIKKREMALELKSSGTSGQTSRMQLDKGSLMRVRRMAWQVFDALGLCDLSNKYDYICFTYDPEVAKDVGTAWTDKLLTGFTGQGEIFYAFKWSVEKGDFYFDIESSIKKLREIEEKGGLVRLIGFPAFALKLTEEYKKRFSRYPKLNPGSFVITGGGWKTLADEAIDKKIYRKILAGNLGLSPDNVRDLFGMVEHGVPYVDCRLGNFHVPVYGKIIPRDPATLAPLPYGVTGLLQFMTSYLTSYPSLSLLSSDWGYLEEKCACGLPGPVLFIKGRAGVKKLKGCAISASQML
ncbi:MAG: hypothetical protein COT17_04060 [Elusimicrobia bacterium CG08_land_8_20_14_0_20_51_18]|nr:MAG: hypothetical protein COT17_04060 [Elusimicrobia bacterium CG08_land_8_20_14_0_20_51_18]